MLNPTLDQLPASLPILLDNRTCVYCGIPLDTVITTKEHVIGRRFVPKGQLDGQWNLIVYACARCNSRKADLEDDISAISMQPDAWGRYAEPAGELPLEGMRKAQNSISRKTGKSVKDSSEKLKVEASVSNGIKISANFASPPQLDSDRVFELARLQMTAFFYLITYDVSSRIGKFWPGAFYPVLEAIRSDWGNPVHRTFMDTVVSWEPRFLADGANGFFRIAMRRHPTAAFWSWALEWNRKYRIVGFFGEREPAEAMASTLPHLKPTMIAQGPNSYVGYRKETPIADDDKLFYWNDQ